MNEFTTGPREIPSLAIREALSKTIRIGSLSNNGRFSDQGIFCKEVIDGNTLATHRTAFWSLDLLGFPPQDFCIISEGDRSLSVVDNNDRKKARPLGFRNIRIVDEGLTGPAIVREGLVLTDGYLRGNYGVSTKQDLVNIQVQRKLGSDSDRRYPIYFLTPWAVEPNAEAYLIVFKSIPFVDGDGRYREFQPDGIILYRNPGDAYRLIPRLHVSLNLPQIGAQ